MGLIQKMVLLDDLDWRGWSINVTDASNQSVLSVLFPQVSLFPMSQGVAIQQSLTTAALMKPPQVAIRPARNCSLVPPPA